jgi:hypothetical protein
VICDLERSWHLGMVWQVFDVECCGPNIRVSEQGLCAEHSEDTEEVDEPPTWEYR